MNIKRKLLSCLVVVGTTVLGTNLSFAEEGWVTGVSVQYSHSSSKWVNAADISGTSIMSKLRQSYSYNTRMAKIKGATTRQNQIMTITDGANKHYANITYTTAPNGAIGFTRWYDSPYGVLLDYLAPFSLNTSMTPNVNGPDPGNLPSAVNDYNRIQFPSGSKTVYLAANMNDLTDAKIASAAMATNNEPLPLVIGTLSGMSYPSSVFSYVDQLKAKTIIMLGGTGIIESTSGLSSNYNVIRVGGLTRKETENFLLNLPAKTKTPSSYTGDGNGVVMQGINNSTVYNELVKLSQTKNIAYLKNAVNAAFNAYPKMGASPSKGQSPSVILGVHNGDFETYWICYFYEKDFGRAVYQYVLPNYFPKINLSKSTSSWTNGNVNVTATFTVDSKVGIASKKWASGDRAVSYFASAGTALPSNNTFTATANGVYTVYVKDTYGNETVNKITISNIDKTSPTASLSPNSRGWGNTNVSVSMSVGDSLSGVKSWRYAVSSNNGSSWGSWISGGGTSGSTTISTDGTSKIKVEVTDNAGNVTTTTSGSYQVDKTLPTATINPNSKSWTNQNISVSMSVGDSTSGVRSWRYAISSNNGASWGSWIAGSGTSATTTLSNAGIYQIKVEVTDNTGNVRTVTSGSYQIDKTVPSSSFSPSSKTWTNTNVPVSMTVSDNASGVKSWRYAVSSNNGSTYGSWIAGGGALGSTTISSEGTSKIKVEVTDNAGNVSTNTSGSYQIDKTSPSITLTSSNTNWTNQNITITASITDNLSGVAVKKWAAGSQSVSYFASNGTSLGSSFTVTNNNTYTVYAKDVAGNESVKTITVGNIDKVNPTITGDFDNAWVKGSKTINFTSKDNLSGIASIKLWNDAKTSVLKTGTVSNNVGSLTHTITTEGTTYYKIETTDNALNSTTANVTVRIDNTPPTASISAPTTTNNRNIAISLSNIVDVHSGAKEVWVSESSGFSSGVTKASLSGVTNKQLIFNLSAKSTIETHFSTRSVYIRVYDNVGNYTTYVKNVKLIPVPPTVPVISLPKEDSLYVKGERILLNWIYDSVDADVGRLPQLKAEITLVHKGGAKDGSNLTYKYIVDGDVFELDFKDLEFGDYDVKVKVFNFLNPEVFSESKVTSFRYNRFKTNGNVFTKDINTSSPIKYLSISTKYELPVNSRIEGFIYYEKDTSGKFNLNKYIKFNLSNEHTLKNMIELPRRVNSIKIQYTLTRSAIDKFTSPILNHVIVLAR